MDGCTQCPIPPPQFLVEGGREMKAIAIALLVSTAGLTGCAGLPDASNEGPVSLTPSAAHANPAVAELIRKGPSGIGLDPLEQALYNKIMDYRREHGLPPIPLSQSLSFVAKLHVRDLEGNVIPTSANYHSWSNKGPWRAVSYSPDHCYAELMWSKPRELTGYRGNGYEIVYMNSEAATPQGAFASWKASEMHNAVLLNERDWSRTRWRAIGIGVFGRYAAVWFGEEPDPATQALDDGRPKLQVADSRPGIADQALGRGTDLAN